MKSSFVIALPVGIVLWAVGVKFALLWAILTFLCNFIPYIGSVIAYTFPVGFAFLFYGVRWEPITAAILLLLIHVASASVVEPMIIGNAVGVSPLVILASLSLWGLLWGLPGMFLAVPLTVVAIIVMDHFETHPSHLAIAQGRLRHKRNCYTLYVLHACLKVAASTEPVWLNGVAIFWRPGNGEFWTQLICWIGFEFPPPRR